MKEKIRLYIKRFFEPQEPIDKRLLDEQRLNIPKKFYWASGLFILATVFELIREYYKSK